MLFTASKKRQSPKFNNTSSYSIPCFSSFFSVSFLSTYLDTILEFICLELYCSNFTQSVE